MPEMQEQETGATALCFRGVGEERWKLASVILGGVGGTVRFLRRCAWAGGVRNERLRLRFDAVRLGRYEFDLAVCLFNQKSSENLVG